MFHSYPINLAPFYPGWIGTRAQTRVEARRTRWSRAPRPKRSGTGSRAALPASTWLWAIAVPAWTRWQALARPPSRPPPTRPAQRTKRGADSARWRAASAKRVDCSRLRRRAGSWTSRLPSFSRMSRKKVHFLESGPLSLRRIVVISWNVYLSLLFFFDFLSFSMKLIWFVMKFARVSEVFYDLRVLVIRLKFCGEIRCWSFE